MTTGKLAQERNDYCPFSWQVLHREAGCLAKLFGVSHVRSVEPQPCMQSKCKLWDKESDNCVFMNVKKLK